MPCGDGICGVCGYWHEPGRSCSPDLVAKAALIEPDVSMPWPPREKDRCGHCGERHILTIERCNPKAEIDRADAPIRMRAYGLCRLCHHFHVDGPCPQVAGEREYRRRQRLLDRAARASTTSLDRAMLSSHGTASISVADCAACRPLIARIRKRFREMTRGSEISSALAGWLA